MNRFHLIHRVLVFPFMAAIVMLTIGCSMHGTDEPISPPISSNETSSELLDASRISTANRAVIGMWTVYVADDHSSIDVVPFRITGFHLNATKMLENGLCTDCLKIGNIQPPSPGELTCDLTIRHPLDEEFLNFTGFDPRAVLITGSDYTFPVSGSTVSLDGTSPRLLNSDGYTSLYNPTEYPESGPGSPLLKYYQGKFAIGSGFTATLNPFIAFSKDQPRRMFLTGSEQTETVHLAVPDGSFQFGYAIDVSWIVVASPVTDPEIDFPLEANSVEAYEFSVEITEVLTNWPGDSVDLLTGVYDHQGFDTISSVTVEAPDFFDGVVEAEYSGQTGPDSWLFVASIQNQYGSGPGEYPVLVRAVDAYSDPNLGQIDGTYLYFVPVIQHDKEPPVAIAQVDLTYGDIGDIFHFSDNGSYDPDGGDIVKYEWDWDGDGSYDDEGIVIDHSFDAEGTYQVGFRVTDDEGTVDEMDEPLEITIEEDTTFLLTDVTPPFLKFEAYDLRVIGNYVYIASPWDGLLIFDISDPTGPVPVSIVEIDNMVQWMDIVGDYAYVSTFRPDEDQNFIYIVDISNPVTAHVVEEIHIDGPCRGIRVADGYAYVRKWTDVEIYDIDPPNTASVVATLPYGGNGYIELVDNYLYLASGNGFVIADVSVPSAPVTVTNIEVFAERAIAIRDGYAFISEVYEDYSYGFTIVDIDPPESAHIVGASIEMPDLVGDISITGDYAFVSSDHKVYAIKISNPETPYVQEILEPDGWASYLGNDGEHLVIGLMQGGFELWDIDPVEMAGLTGEFLALGFDFNEKLHVSDEYAVITGVMSGLLPTFTLYIVDINPPESARVVNFLQFDMSPHQVIASKSHVYLVRDFYSGSINTVDIIDVDPPELMHVVSSVNVPANLGEAVLHGDYLYLCSGDDGLTILDVNPPELASVVHTITDAGGVIWNPRLLDYSDGYLYALGASYIHQIDITDPETAYVMESGYCYNNQDYMRVADGYSYSVGYDFVIHEIDPISSAHTVYYFNPDEYCPGIDLYNGHAFVADYDYGLRVFDIWPPETSYQVTGLSVPGLALLYPVISDGYLYMSAWTDGMTILKID